MLVFGVFIGNIGPIDENMTRKRSNLHLFGCFIVQYLHFGAIRKMIKAVMGVEQTTKIATIYIQIGFIIA